VNLPSCGVPASSASASITTATRAVTKALSGFAPREARLVLCLVGGFEDRHQELLARLGPHKAGNPYLKRLADVDLDVLRELVDRSVRVRRGLDRARGAPQAQ